MKTAHILIAFLALSCALAPAQTDPGAGAWKTWGISAGTDFRVPPSPANARAELQWLRNFIAERDATAVRQVRYWDAGSPNYRWVELTMTQLQQQGQLVPGPGNRALSLLNVAIYDATVAAWDAKYFYKRPRPTDVDPTIPRLLPNPESPSYPSEHAVAAGAAAAVLSYLFPADAQRFNALAEEAGRSRLFAGVQYPSDVTAGLQLGRDVAARVIERARNDRSDLVFSGSIPAGAGYWTGVNPAFPMGGSWMPWVLPSASQFRPGPPPAIDSAQMAADIAEIKLPRTVDTSRAALFWAPPGEGVFLYWYDNLAKMIFEERLDSDPPRAARAYALLSIAHYDAWVACWDAKYTYWLVRPNQLDPTITTLFPNPNHPSYPSGHSCMAGATSEALAYSFPQEADSIRVQSAMSRVWAGIHYRVDIETGLRLGRQVAGAVIDRVKQDGAER
jgi:membrane-associated phospholipid phosphatase